MWWSSIAMHLYLCLSVCIYVSLSGHPHRFLAIICMAHNCVQRMRPQATGSNTLSGSIIYLYIRPSICPVVYGTFEIFIFYQFPMWGSSTAMNLLMKLDTSVLKMNKEYDECIVTLYPILEINTNTKIANCLWTTRWMDILYCHSGDLTLCPAVACDARNYGPHFYDHQKVMRMNIKRDRGTYIRKERDKDI